MNKLKMKNNVNREAPKISALSSGKTDKYGYLAGEEIFLSDQSRIINQANVTYSPLGKAFEKQIKTNGEQGKDKFELQKF